MPHGRDEECRDKPFCVGPQDSRRAANGAAVDYRLGKTPFRELDLDHLLTLALHGVRVKQEFGAYRRTLRDYYARETRWPDRPFWQRRQAASPAASYESSSAAL